MSKNLVVLISGRGSNMQTIHKRTLDGTISGEIKAVVSNNPEAGGLGYAAENALATHVINHKEFASRESFDQQLIDQIDVYEPDYLILAGFMRILTPGFVDHYHGRLINIHPSLLPRHQGLHTHERALAEGDKEHGASVHFVTAELDAGPVIMQAKIRIEAHHTAESLQQDVLKMEHLLYPQAIALLCSDRIEQHQDTTICDGEPLDSPLILT